MSMSPSDLLGGRGTVNSPPPSFSPSTPSSKRGPGEWWFRLTAPREPEHATFAQRETVRRGRLASITVLFISLYALIPVPNALLKGNDGFLVVLLVTLVINALTLVFLNRRGHLVAAGWVIVTILDAGYALSFLAIPGGVSLEILPAFDLMTSALLVVVAFFPPRSVFIVMIINIVVISLWLLFGPHTSEITQLLKTGPYDLFYPSISLEIFAATLVFLWVNSAVKAIADLDRSEEIVALERREIAQQQEQLTLKQQLEDGVQTILQTHVRAANGDFSARAPLNKDNVLWQVAYSLNNLLARLQSNQQLQAEMNATRLVISKLTSDIRQGKPIQLQPTGTALDELIIALATATNNSSNQVPAAQQSVQAQQAFPSQQTFPAQQAFPSQRPASRPNSVSLSRDEPQWTPPARKRNI